MNPSQSSSSKRKEIVIPVSKIKTKKGSLDLTQEIEEAAERLTEEIEKNPWDIHGISKDEKGVKALEDGKIAVKFTKFIQLIFSHDFTEEFMEQYRKEDIIISSDLLVDLAATPYEDTQENKFSWVFMGVVLGAISVAILFMIFFL